MGDVGDMGLSEYLSRAARALLVWACYRALQERRRRDGLSIWGATSDLAGEVGVTDRTVERWLSRGIQSCNVNADRILEVAMGLCPREVTEIVLDDLGAHARATEGFLVEKFRQGGVGPMTEDPSKKPHGNGQGDEAATRIIEMFHEIHAKDPRSRCFSASHVNGCVTLLRLDLAREYLPRLAEIINDPANHTPIGGPKT